MRARKFCSIAAAAFAFLLADHVQAATFGTVIPIGGEAADIALDEPRGVLYIANYTRNRIDVLSVSGSAILRSINVAPQPSSLALSPDGRFLISAHFAMSPVFTLINLQDNTRQTFGLTAAPLGVAFGADGQALIVTTTDFLLFDPVSGTILPLGTVQSVAAKALPVPLATFPPQIVEASLGVSGDKSVIIGLTNTFRFSYNVTTQQILPLGYIAAGAPLGPRVVSVSRDGSYYAAGWALYGCGGGGLAGCDAGGPLMAEFAQPLGALNRGGHAIDSAAGLIYAQVPSTATDAPAFVIADSDNLNVRERILLPENFGGKALLNSAGDTMYAISDSGVTVLPVGALNQAHRVVPDREDLLFLGNFCDRTVTTQELNIVDRSGGATPFSISTTMPGIRLSKTSSVTPAKILVSADPTFFGSQNGTITGSILINSPGSVNVAPPVRVLVNNREPDQRGTVMNIPGTLVDLLADPVRDRFYILRQDRNALLVFDGSTYQQIATLRTGATPTQMAITFDRQYVIVGHEHSQLAYIYNLDTLERVGQIRMPSGHYPRSIASASRTILAASRVDANSVVDQPPPAVPAKGGPHTIDRIDFASGTAVTLPSLGVFANTIHVDTRLIASPNGASILAAMPDGNVLLYNSSADSFTVSRKDVPLLNGAYAASAYDQFMVGNSLLNASLVKVRDLYPASSPSSGFAFTGDTAIRIAPGSSSGLIQRLRPLDGQSSSMSPPTRVAESPLINATGFSRTLAPLSNGQAIVALTTSGFSVLAWDYDSAIAQPQFDKVVSAANLAPAVAPGGFVTLFGQNMSGSTETAKSLPLPTVLAQSCLTVNGALVPLLYASPSQINAQLPFTLFGNATLALHTPGGVSDDVPFTIQPSAPAVFSTNDGSPIIIRNEDGKLITRSTPIHLNDKLTIYLTGLGATSPPVRAGDVSPTAPLSTTTTTPTITIGGSNIFVLYSGLAPGQVGLYQINAQVPFRNFPTGSNLPFTIKQGASSTTVPVFVQE